MYQITVEQHFDAAHALRGYQGKCENLHGHRFRVVARLRTSKLNEIGLAFDFRDLKTRLNEVLERFDHTNLNEVAPFNTINPSSENLASTIFNELQPKLPGINLVSVEVWESPDASAEYRPQVSMQAGAGMVGGLHEDEPSVAGGYLVSLAAEMPIYPFETKRGKKLERDAEAAEAGAFAWLADPACRSALQ